MEYYYEKANTKDSIKKHIVTELYSALKLLSSGTNELDFRLKGLDRLKENSNIVELNNADSIFFLYAQLNHYEDIWKNRQNYSYDYYIIEKNFRIFRTS